VATHSGNFSHTDPASKVTVENGDTFERCNISQLVPDTAICAGKTGLTFTSCNLVNCSVPGDAVVEHCNTAQISRCAHLHPEWDALPAEADDCPHVVDTDIIEGEGGSTLTIYHRKDTVL